jgi:hypothetical protein
VSEQGQSNADKRAGGDRARVTITSSLATGKTASTSIRANTAHSPCVATAEVTDDVSDASGIA